MQVGDTVSIGFQSWAGYTSHKAVIERETPKRYAVRWLEDTIKHKSGSTSLVPKWAAVKVER